jgi:OFA family oxalate/formate antiporter-like MFS transporter
MGKENHPRLVVAEGLLSNLLLGVLFVWSVLRNPLLDLFPAWNEGMLSLIFGIHNLFTCLGILLGGRLCSRFPTRRVYLAFALMVFLGLSGFAFLPVDRPRLAYFMAMGLFWFAAVGIGVGINVVQSTTIPWFPTKSGAISGGLYMALGVSSVLLAALARVLLPLIGVKLLMPVFGVIILAAALLVLADRRSIQPPAAKAVSQAELTGYRPGEMLKAPAFWLLFLWNVSLRTSGLILLDHAASMAVAFGGMALVAMLIAPANGLGSLSVGVALDRLGMGRIMGLDAALFVLAAALLCAGVGLGRFGLILPGLLLGGYAYGGSSSSYAAAIKNQFGTKYYTQTFAVSNLAMGCAALLESTSGSVLDLTGSYSPVMGMVLALAVAALILSLPAAKYFKPAAEPLP